MHNPKCQYHPFKSPHFDFSAIAGLCFVILMMASSFSIAQTSLSDEKAEAKLFFSNKKYATALSLLQRKKELYRDDKESKFLIALCYYQLNQLDAALQQLNRISEEERSPYPEIWLYYGRIYHARHQFDQASTYYKRYLRTIRPGDSHRQMVIEEIRRCANGISLQFQEAVAVVENLGKGVNTENDEFAPMLSPNYGDRLYFSSIRPGNIGGARKAGGGPDERLGDYLSDMFNCQLQNGIWSNVQPMHYLLNSPSHEVLLGFNGDGSALYYFKGQNLNSGLIIVDTFKRMEERLVSSTPLLAPMNVRAGDGNPFFYNDTLLLFSSNRPGGYGGRDLYKSSLKNGRWSSPVNLGPDINTAYDETTPFLARDGHTLFFSTNDSKRSIGGLDVLKSFYVEETGRWTTPSNLGMPINSAADDDYFKISGDGFTAFFASSRKDGFGQRDLYIAYFQNFLEEMEWPANYRPVRNNQEVPIVSAAQQVPPPPSELIPNKTVPSSNEFDKNFQEPPLIKPEATTSPNIDAPFAPIYFSQAEELTRHATKKETLDLIAKEMRKQPSLTVVFSLYPEKVNAEGLFELVETFEAAGNYLIAAGVDAKAIYIRAIGVEKSQRNGQCVEISFFDGNGLNLPNTLPVIGINAKNVESGLVTNEALHYKVQVASAKKSINEPFQQGVDYIMIERQMDFPYYRYTLGATATYREASVLKQNLVKKGFDGAYVVPFVNAYRVDKTLARLKMEAYPDLKNFLQIR
ncbi:MAG: tetratricopeptide repeat protein [Saprospiraceae bacterium]